MSIDATDDATTLEDRLARFMRRNFPQIQMHGGSAGIDAIDEASGEVWISLGGACSGCGISPMTVQALKSRMVMEFDEISQVHATTGGSFDYDERPADPLARSREDAPF